MKTLREISEAFAAVRQQRALWLLHLVGNATLLLAAYGWLLIPEASWWQLGGTLLLAALIASASSWLQGGSLAYLIAVRRGASEQAWPEFRQCVRRIPWLLSWLLLLASSGWLIDAAAEYTWGWGAMTASWLTLKLQRPVSPESVQFWYDRLPNIASWFAFLLLLPLAAAVVRRDLTSTRFFVLRNWWAVAKQARYWWIAFAYLVAGMAVPQALIGWVPEFKSIQWEWVSLAIRFGAAYIVAITAWLAILAWLAKPPQDEISVKDA